MDGTKENPQAMMGTLGADDTSLDRNNNTFTPIEAKSTPACRPANPTVAPSVGHLDPSDKELVECACQAGNGAKFNLLWSGNADAYSNLAEADLVLCNLLAFWTVGDPKRIDRLFRRSALMRPEWNERQGERTYGERVIAKVLYGT